MKALAPVDDDFSLSDHVYRMFREAVLDMDVYATDADLRLEERKLSEQLRVSRTPIREALKRLETEGFVEIRARRGIFIVKKSRDDVLDMVIVWAALESMAARLACERASESDILRLLDIGKSYSAGDAKARIDEYSESNIEFHRMILDLSGCARLVEQGDEIFAHLMPIRRRAMRDSSRTDRSVVDHTNIIDAIAGRKPDLASDLVREHTMRLHDYLKDSWERLVDNDDAPDEQSK